MNQRAITMANTLTYSGTLPLVAALAAIVYPMDDVNAAQIAITYSAIIISFLCGIHWAVYLFFSETCPRNLLITSNIVALLAWGALLASNHVLAMLLHALCFLYLLTLDLKLRDEGIYPDWFYRLRRNATIIVVLSLSTIIGLS